MVTTKATREVATAPLKIIDGGKSEKLTGKQLAYVQAILKGANQSDAYREAYNAENMSAQAIWTEAGRLFRHPEVSRRITAGRAAQERQAVHTGAALRLHVEKELFELTTTADSDQAKLRAIELPIHDKFVTATRDWRSYRFIGMTPYHLTGPASGQSVRSGKKSRIFTGFDKDEIVENLAKQFITDYNMDNK